MSRFNFEIAFRFQGISVTDIKNLFGKFFGRAKIIGNNPTKKIGEQGEIRVVESKRKTDNHY